MTRKSTVTSINCTSCGAGLDVLGGGRVQTHVCGYCGSQLDAQDDYKVLQQFSDIERPDSPFRIGMTGQIKGVDYTVIGTLGFEERYAGMTWRWVDHQLYSPTHGYAFITVEKGHLIFSRAYRKATDPDWLSPTQIEMMQRPPSVAANGKRFRYYDTSEAKIVFAEGEFNWKPKIGDTSSTVSVMSDDMVLAFSRTATEEEITQSIYPDQAEIAMSFGLEYLPELQGTHRLQPYSGGQNSEFIKKTALFAMLVCLAIYTGLLIYGSGNTAYVNDNIQLPDEVVFDVTAPNRIARMQLQGNFSDSWAFFDIEVVGPDDETIFATGRTISYYSGRDSEGSWTEGSRRTSLRFRPQVSGEHRIILNVAEQESRNAFSQLRVEVTEGALVARWFLFAAFFFLAIWLYAVMGYAQHQRKRWRGMDWND